MQAIRAVARTSGHSLFYGNKRGAVQLSGPWPLYWYHWLVSVQETQTDSLAEGEASSVEWREAGGGFQRLPQLSPS